MMYTAAAVYVRAPAEPFQVQLYDLVRWLWWCLYVWSGQRLGSSAKLCWIHGGCPIGYFHRLCLQRLRGCPARDVSCL
jgi:hypothetical protein